MEIINRTPISATQPDTAAVPAPATRSLPFLIGLGLFGLGLTAALNILDPFIYQ